MKIIDAIKVWIAYKKAVKLIKETNMEEGKKWYQSKTIWFNGLSGVLVVADKVAGSNLISSPQVQQGLALFLTIGNAILRFSTNEPLKK